MLTAPLAQAVVLRRVKSQQVNGRPIVELPSKSTTVVELDFSDRELAFYRGLEAKQQDAFEEYVREGFGVNYANILVCFSVTMWSFTCA